LSDAVSVTVFIYVRIRWLLLWIRRDLEESDRILFQGIWLKDWWRLLRISVRITGLRVENRTQVLPKTEQVY